MRVNVYAEEMTNRVEIITKTIEGQEFTAVRFYLELPVTLHHNGDCHQLRGPFEHHPGDDDSSAVTFWGKQNLKAVLQTALAKLEEHEKKQRPKVVFKEPEEGYVFPPK